MHAEQSSRRGGGTGVRRVVEDDHRNAVEQAPVADVAAELEAVDAAHEQPADDEVRHQVAQGYQRRVPAVERVTGEAGRGEEGGERLPGGLVRLDHDGVRAAGRDGGSHMLMVAARSTAD